MTTHIKDKANSIASNMRRKVTKRAIADMICFKRENAQSLATLLGLSSVYFYDNGENGVWLPGKTLAETAEYCNDVHTVKAKVFIYKDPITQEFYYFQRQGVKKKKDGQPLIFVEESEDGLAHSIAANFPKLE